MKWQHGAVALATLALIWASTAISPAVQAGKSRDDARAPAFSVRTLDGKPLPHKKFDGKPLIVDFWATWCGPCRFAMPHLDAVQERYADQGLQVLGVSVDEIDPERVRKFTDRLGVKFQIAMASESMLEDYGPLRALPTTYFINRQGEVVRKVVGYIDEETLDAYTQEILE